MRRKNTVFVSIPKKLGSILRLFLLRTEPGLQRIIFVFLSSKNSMSEVSSNWQDRNFSSFQKNVKKLDSYKNLSVSEQQAGGGWCMFVIQSDFQYHV